MKTTMSNNPNKPTSRNWRAGKQAGTLFRHVPFLGPCVWKDGIITVLGSKKRYPYKTGWQQTAIADLPSKQVAITLHHSVHGDRTVVVDMPNGLKGVTFNVRGWFNWWQNDAIPTTMPITHHIGWAIVEESRELGVLVPA